MLKGLMEDNNFDAPVETKTDNSESVNTTEEVAKNTNATEENNELAEAYYKKEGNYPITVGAEHYTIKDSSVSPYQRLTTSIVTGAAYFYRVDKDAEWIFFKSTLDALACDEYTSGIRKTRRLAGF